MAGKPGMKGGGGSRPGAGRKPNPPKLIEVAVVDAVESVADAASKHDDPKGFLLALMNNNEVDIKLRVDAAKSLMAFMHMKLGDVGKKDEKAQAAKKASTGKFGAAPPPLKLVNGA